MVVTFVPFSAAVPEIEMEPNAVVPTAASNSLLPVTIKFCEPEVVAFKVLENFTRAPVKVVVVLPKVVAPP